VLGFFGLGVASFNGTAILQCFSWCAVIVAYGYPFRLQDCRSCYVHLSIALAFFAAPANKYKCPVVCMNVRIISHE
jgi:hypothetical protein